MYLQKLKKYVMELFLNDNIISIVDIGCRSAEWLRFFQDNSNNKDLVLTGIDTSSTYFNLVPYDSKIINLSEGNFNSKGFLKEKKYDVLFMKDIFEFIQNKEQFINEILNGMNAQGCLIVISCDFENIEICGDHTPSIKKAIEDFTHSCLNGELSDSEGIERKIGELFFQLSNYQIEKHCFLEQENVWTSMCSGELYINMLENMYYRMNMQIMGKQIREEFNLAKETIGYFFKRQYYIYKVYSK